MGDGGEEGGRGAYTPWKTCGAHVCLVRVAPRAHVCLVRFALRACGIVGGG